MASESVNTTDNGRANEYVPPGWDELLVESSLASENFGKMELERISAATYNTIELICDGMTAIGELQWRAYADPRNAPASSVGFALGGLQTTLADLLIKLRLIESNATFGLHKLELSESKVAAPVS